MLPLVALVGRPNVGKSTLFNALTRTRDALVHDEPGVTRDRNYGTCRSSRAGRSSSCDTGGLSGEDEGLAGATAKQSRAAAEEADLILFIVDGRDGPDGVRPDGAAWLRKSGKPFFLVVNKTDGLDEAATVNEFARFGAQTVVPSPPRTSAACRRWCSRSSRSCPKRRHAGARLEPGRVAVTFIGRPNVGKSTLVNRLLGEERMIASDVPGTTRDSIAVDLERDGRKYRLVDTAGLRKRGRVEEAVEKFSTFKTMQAIENAHVSVVLLDANEGVTEQDATVLGHVLEAGKALVVAVNKWDGQSTYQRDQVKALLDRKLSFAEWAEQVTISAKHGTGMRELFKAIDRAYASATREFSTSETNKALEMAVQSFPPPVQAGHAAKLRYAHPGGSNPPTVHRPWHPAAQAARHLQALPRELLPQALQAGRHADPLHLPRRREPVRRAQERADREAGRGRRRLVRHAKRK
jgi:GTP-binding protein